MRKQSHCVLLLVAIGLLAPAAARATWSIIVVDTRTKEIGIGSATCLLSFNLRTALPVVRVDQGAAAAQSYVDSSGQNRLRIWNGLIAGTDPAAILQQLAMNDPGHQTRQYGIVDVRGRALTFTGTLCGPYASGLTGSIGDLVYAIQGNVITGQCVLSDAEAALRNTPGGIPEKLMAAMEAARAVGGDGRCSCSAGNPPGCGCPPASFTKSAHIGFMIVTRRGDVNSPTCNAGGCANGTYYMNFNVIATQASQPDPVIQLRQQFDTWRTGLIGRPDQVESRVILSPRLLPDDGRSQATMTIDLLDWQGMPASAQTVEVLHDPAGSAGLSSIGAVTPLGGGRYRVPITAGATAGVDTLAVRVTDGGNPRFLIPSPQLLIQPRGDMNGDGVVNNFDIDGFVLALTDPAGYQQRYPEIAYAVVGDINRDGQFNPGDIDPFVQLLVRR